MTDSDRPDVPADVPIDPANPPSPEDLPELPPGHEWGLKIEGEAEIIRADGSTETVTLSGTFTPPAIAGHGELAAETEVIRANPEE